MLLLKPIMWFAACLVVSGSNAKAADIGGTISSTRTITEDSQLVDDVNCVVIGGPCIVLGASGITLELNGFTVTGLGDSQTGCGGMGTPGEFGIDVNGQQRVVIRGPGMVQQFRNNGIRINNSTGVTITGVTTATNCFSGIILIGGAEHVLENNVAVRNGHVLNPCGGI